jgi:hypothetical protein
MQFRSTLVQVQYPRQLHSYASARIMPGAAVVHSGSSGGAATEIQSRSRAFGWACEPPLAMEFKVAAMASSLRVRKWEKEGWRRGWLAGEEISPEGVVRGVADQGRGRVLGGWPW